MADQEPTNGKPQGESKRADLSVGKTDRPAGGPPPGIKARPIMDPVERGAMLGQRVDEAIKDKTDLREKIIAAVSQVEDPEIPVNIYDLGLIYDIQPDPAGNVAITMTLTSPACPEAQELPLAVQRAVQRIPEVMAVEVDITFDPPWDRNMMSDVAKITLDMM
jgi:FeS assembly SUF system protein